MKNLKMDNDTQLLPLIMKLQTKLTSVVNTALSSFGIRYPQYRLLQILSTSDRLNPSYCARQLSIEGSSMTKQIDALEKMKLISRQYDNHDRRFVWVEINHEGKRVATAAAEAVKSSMDIFLSELKAQKLDSFIDMCRAMLSQATHPAEFNASNTTSHPQETEHP
ncbi:MarR family transcriptional regulator [Pseudomonas putida]|uniref:MarR family winged helix-turn-helix transcriptional regulator n=1 Tax=Pseudomonas putida TaxID=303 RepID=UPI002363759E|nr:MarR family transcriptional regulator [Pseudomonas putida]MDD2067785.1 MarR family transcriptional regulator [Pseudomonas putida]HDS1738327.1 MarR family transcriptional regulator [Pseudomonas putida]